MRVGGRCAVSPGAKTTACNDDAREGAHVKSSNDDDASPVAIRETGAETSVVDDGA